jgi:hypothetical protein
MIKLIILVLLTGCAATNNAELSDGHANLDSKIFYKRDMIITYKGITTEGVAVLPAGLPAYSIEVEARGDLDVFAMTDCHMELLKEEAWNIKKTIRRGPFKLWKRKIDDRRKIRFTYSPSEVSKDYCPIDLGGFEQGKGRHSWGYIIFRPPGGLEADLACNGSDTKEKAVAICQGKRGLIQNIRFREKVLIDEKENCGIKTEAPFSGTDFDFTLPAGNCTALFLNKKGSFQLDLIGYDALKIRSSKND